MTTEEHRMLKDSYEKVTGAKIIYLGNNTSIDVKTLLPNDYSNLTNDNFIVGAVSAASKTNSATRGNTQGSSTGCTVAAFNLTKSYNSSTGILTISGSSVGASGGVTNWWGTSASSACNIFAYAVIGNIINV